MCTWTRTAIVNELGQTQVYLQPDLTLSTDESMLCLTWEKPGSVGGPVLWPDKTSTAWFNSRLQHRSD